MSLDKSGKQHLKDEARAERGKQKRKEKKARKKAKQQARKAASKKTRDSSASSNRERESSSSDKSLDSSTSGGESNPGKRIFTCKAGAASSGALEFKIIHGKRHLKSQAGKWVDCSGPLSKLCERCGQRHW